MSDRSRPVLMEDRVPGLLILLGGFALYLNTLAPALAPRDSAEWAVVCATLGIPHAPGYPLYVLAGKCATLLVPWANMAYRLNLASALFSSLALWALYHLCRKLSFARLAAGGVCLFLGVSGAFWTHAGQAEVFGLHMLLVITGLTAALSHPTLSAILLGLSLGNHHTSLFALPCAALWFFSTRKLPAKKGTGLLLTLFLLSALSIQGVIFVRAGQKPDFQIAKANTARDLIHTLLRRDYGTFRLYKPSQDPVKKFPPLAGGELCLKAVWDGIGPVGVGLAAAGAIFLSRSRPLLSLGLALLFLLAGPIFFTLAKPTADPVMVETVIRFESLMLLPVLIFLACGLSETLRRLTRGPGLALGGLVLGCGLWLGYQHWRSDQRARFSAQDLCLNIVTDVPRPGLLFISGDTLTFCLNYAQKVEKKGKGILLVVPREDGRRTAKLLEEFHRLWPRETKKAGWLKRIARGGRLFASFEPGEVPEAFPESEGWTANPRGLLLSMHPLKSPRPPIQSAHFYRFRQTPRLAENQRIYDLEIFSLYLKAYLRNAARAVLKKRSGLAGEWLSQAEIISPSSKGARELRKKMRSLETRPGKW